MTRLRRTLPPPAPATLAVAAIVLVLAPAPAPADPAGGIDRAGMDMAVGPGDDFFAYANGDWVKATEIPPDRASWGANAMLAERVDKQVAALIEGARQSPGRPGSPTRKVGDYYASYMDEAGIEARGVEPLKPGLAAIAAIADRTALAAALGATLRADVDALNSTNFRTDNLFGLWVAADLDRPDRYLPFLLQGGLSLRLRHAADGRYSRRVQDPYRKDAGPGGHRRSGRQGGGRLRSRIRHRPGALDSRPVGGCGKGG
jgi:putative endopeptidase